jgi:hypothetical protein
MNFDPNDVLRRFHRALVREIQASNPELLGAPFSVAEIYQNLVPYRTHRDEIGVEMNADYEHALLRLLAGESDYLTIESRTARQEIREELESPNPNTALYRDFAAADVRLNPDRIDEALMWEPGQSGMDEGPPTAPPEASEPEPQWNDTAAGTFVDEDPGEEKQMTDQEEVEGVGEGEPEEENLLDEGFEEVVTHLVAEVDSEEDPVELSGEETPWSEIPEVEEEDEEPVALSEEEEQEASPPQTCAWCREALPQRPGVNFCPFCGCSVHLVPCPECGEELELNWRFCIACGTEVLS